MKTVIILGDGMADFPVARLGNRTPLQAARKPNMDRVARLGRMGLFTTVPEGMAPGSEVANMTVLGYDARQCYQGRAVLEAASMGIALAPDDVAFRCNLIAAAEGNIQDHSAGHITTEEAAQLIEDLDRELGGNTGEHPVRFHAGVCYRHLLVFSGWGSAAVECKPPHDNVGGRMMDLLPKAKDSTGRQTAQRLVGLWEKSMPMLANHPVNIARQRQGLPAAHSIWPWSPGHKPHMPLLTERFSIRGSVISAVDLIMGLGRYAGLTPIYVPGATGLWDTNYEGKAQACLDALKDCDLVYVHVEATDEASHMRDLGLKIRCIEQLDERLLGPILQGLEARGIEAIVAVLPDHPTPVETGLHSKSPVPVAIWSPGIQGDATERFDEEEAARGSLGMLQGDAFIRLALGR